ncbi:MAG TPA: hypothetical protein VGR11_17115 [Solirubrobacteraceae bacterium]|nr:hypothetical protein [Solirubrobacteraceae bacterium]
MAVALLGLPAPGRASPLFPPCTSYAPGYDAFKAADVVAEGVLLSGPSFYGALLSPARFHVVRYLKGRGPRIVWVRTPQRQVATGDMSHGVAPEFARAPDNAMTPRAGEAYRLFVRTRRRDGNRRDVRDLIDTCTGDDRRISIDRVLRRVPHTLVRRRHGREAFSARLYRRGPHLRCLRLVAKFSDPNPHLVRSEDHGACGYIASRRSTLVATETGARTAVALAGKGLSGFTATRLSDGAHVDASARGGIALALLPGGLERREIGIVARYRDGSTRTFGGLERRASIADPLGGPAWFAEHERAYPSTARRRACVVVWPDLGPGRSGECGSSRVLPFFFAIRRSFRLSIDDAGRAIWPHRHTVVFGAISQAVSDLTVTSPDGPRQPAISSRGRSFIALLPGHVSVSQLTVTFDLKDGRTLSYTGRRQLNLAPPPPP